MVPLILNPAKVTIGLAGQGSAYERRRAFLTEAGVAPMAVPGDGGADLGVLDVLYIAGLGRKPSESLARRARAIGLLVNVEDQPDLCDFHVPAVVRRGDLLLTVSSAGRSPGLVRLIREWLGARFGSDWSGHVGELGRRRDAWRADGVAADEISRKTRDIAAAWLP